MSNSKNNPTINIQAVGDMSLGQQMAHAKRTGHDSFIATNGRLYILKKGKWELVPQPKLDPAVEAEIRKVCAGQPEHIIQQVIMTVAMTKVS